MVSRQPVRQLGPWVVGKCLGLVVVGVLAYYRRGAGERTQGSGAVGQGCPLSGIGHIPRRAADEGWPVQSVGWSVLSGVCGPSVRLVGGSLAVHPPPPVSVQWIIIQGMGTGTASK